MTATPNASTSDSVPTFWQANSLLDPRAWRKDLTGLRRILDAIPEELLDVAGITAPAPEDAVV